VTENLELNETLLGTNIPSSVVATEETITVNSGVALTIGEGKTVIPDLYGVFR